MGLFGRRHDVDEEVDEWAYELTRKDSFPLAATIAGSVVILIAAILTSGQVRHHDLFAAPLGIGTVIALAVWAIAFLITLRHAALGWKIGSFVAMLLVGLSAGLIVIGARINAIRDDLRAVAEVKVNPTFGVEEPEGGARGPISKATFAYLKGVADASMKHRAAIRALGYDAMASPVALRQNPALLAHCDQRATVTPMIEAYYAGRRAAFERFRADIAAIDLDETFRKGMIAGNKEAGQRFDKLLERNAANEHGQVGELVAMCQVLARHHWVAQYGRIAFSSPADLRDFQTHARREQDLSDEATGLMRESMAVMENGRAMIRRSIF
ncbi:hypothetical protein QH494_24195 [Sphingomonas sp. AR_OL41]|uniref:hypothetical protein n=1 Tax=Sphingomonas sp. AR_OL41 TaxID=3042729 RepID=UPI0024815C3B|nr:hypothetical protein [Sphingomonas sp. AR_OL41]MDH7975299.1 hypothetical protein [Sphingomonas sp. AR_OL41]